MKKRLTVILIAFAIGCIPCALAQEDGWDSMIRSTDGSADVSAIHLPEFDAPKFNADPQMDVNPLPTEAPTDVPAPVTPDPGEEPVLPGEPQPTVNPLPTPEPTAKPTAVPTAEPTPESTAKPTAEPTAKPTAVPTAEPTPEPTAKPTPKPTAEPTAVPTDEPAPITPAPEEEPVLTAEPQPTVNPLPTAEPECPHNFERIIDSVSSTLVNQNDRKHSVDVVCHDRCTLCGTETARRRETILEAHRFSDKGQMEAVHQNGLGHAYYDLCACGAARYTGSYGTLDSCRICNPAAVTFSNISNGDFVTAGEDLVVRWYEVEGADHYEFAARYTDESGQCVARGNVGLRTEAVVPSVKPDKILQLWVGVFADSVDTEPISSVTIQVKTTGNNDPGHKLSDATIDDPNYYYSNEFIMFEKDASVREGYIRFVSQIPGYRQVQNHFPAVFDADQWIYKDDNGRIIYDRSAEADDLCSYAALSMQLSYLGVDCTPGKMFSILKGEGFNRDAIIKYLREHEGANIDGERKGLNDHSLTKDTLDNMLTSYEDNSSYSPVLLFMEYGPAWKETHAVVVIGRSGNKYYLANPESQTGMGSFEVDVDENGIMYIKNASASKYNGRRISTVAQTWKMD